MGLCAGLGVSSCSQWKAGRVSKLWLVQEWCDWLAAGFLLAFWGGAAAGFACPTGACWLAGAGSSLGKARTVPSWHQHAGKAMATWHFLPGAVLADAFSFCLEQFHLCAVHSE